MFIAGYANTGKNFSNCFYKITFLRKNANLFVMALIKGRCTQGVLLPEHALGSFCTCQYTRGRVFNEFAQFASGACSQIFNLLNIVEHFAGWKFCSRALSIPMKSLVHTEELCSRSVPLEHAPGAKSLVCVGLKREILTSRKVLYTNSCTRNQFLFCKQMLSKIRIFLLKMSA